MTASQSRAYRSKPSVRGFASITVAATCILACSCQSVAHLSEQQSIGAMQSAAVHARSIPIANTHAVQQVAYNAPAALPSGAFRGGPVYGHDPAAAMGQSCPCCGPTVADSGHTTSANYPPGWRPDGVTCPWPEDEYLFDGGDRDAAVEVLRDWTVLGLDQEDTVAHYDTIDGQTQVKPSNRVKLYAPRFASVRKVFGIKQHENRFAALGMEQPVRLVQEEERSLATTAVQQVQPDRYLVSDTPDMFRENTRGMGVAASLPVAGLTNGFSLFEDFLAIRQGIFDNSEKARMNRWLDAAQVWSENQAVQVTIDNITAVEASEGVGLQSVYKYEMPDGKPCVRVIKVASKKQAQPGEEVEFTIRFDNVGNQTVGNVTLIDNLTTRLEYVADSAQCDLEANFITQENEGESLVMRWEILDPLEVGKGGIIRFKCKVR